MQPLPTRPIEVPLAQWARQIGRSIRQLRYAIRHDHLDVLALPPGSTVVRDLNGRYTIRLTTPLWRRAALYARAFGPLGRYHLDEQALALQAWAQTQPEIQVVREVQEMVPPGQSPPGLLELLSDSKIDVIVVLAKDRLNFGNYALLSASLGAQGRGILALLDDVLDVGDQMEAVRALLLAVQRRVSAIGDGLSLAPHDHPEWLQAWLGALQQVPPNRLPPMSA